MGKKMPKKRKMAKIDVVDVQDAIEDEASIKRMKQKNEKFTGQMDTNDDADGLFTVDTKGTFEGISKTSRRQLARAKLFPPKGPNLGLSWTEDAKITKAERQVEARARPVPAKGPEVFDLWGAGSSKAKPALEHSRVRTSAKPLYENVKMPGTLHQKVGLAPAVIPAHEGQSMNPHKDAYEDLACMAAAAELERERDLEELERKIRPMTHELRDAVGAEKLAEMTEEEKIQLYRKLHLKREEAAREGADEDDDMAGLSKRARKAKLKSQALKNKRKKRLHLGAIELQAESQKRLEKSVGALGSELKNMKADDKHHKDRKEYREGLLKKARELEATEGVVPKRRKIGGGRYSEEAQILPDAISLGGSLRSTPLRASAVRDRLTSVVRRGLLPPPSEASKATSRFHKKKNNKLKNNRKYMSPLLKDNLLLR